MATDDASQSRIRALTALVLVGTFLLGSAVGSGLLFWLTPRRPQPPPAPIFHMLAELGLNAAQQQQAQALRERHEPKLHAILIESMPKLRAVHDQMEADLRAILTPEQRQKLDEIERRRPFRGAVVPPPRIGPGEPDAGLLPPFPPLAPPPPATLLPPSPATSPPAPDPNL